MLESLDVSAPLIVNDDTFTLRRLQEDDLLRMKAIEQRSHAHPWSEQDLRSSLAAHSCIGLQHEHNCIAYAVLSFVVGEAELLLFVVDTPWRGRGIGKMFLQRVLDCAQARARTVFLEVRLSNAVAIGLYESLGFNLVGSRANYYPLANGRREDALLYAIELL